MVDSAHEGPTQADRTKSEGFADKAVCRTGQADGSLVVEVLRQGNASASLQVKLPVITAAAFLAIVITEAGEAIVGTFLAGVCLTIENKPLAAIT